MSAGLESPFVLAIDMGTSSTRALLFDRQGKAVPESETQLPYDVLATPDGGVELDPALVLQRTLACVDGALVAARTAGITISLVAVSCFWHSLLGLDERGRPVTPIYMWGDTRSRFAANVIRGEIDVEQYRQECGVTIHSSYWPAKLRWLRDTAPDDVARVHRWASAADYLAWVWQGADRVCTAMATGTGKSAGSAARNCVSACGPPVEQPIITTRGGTRENPRSRNGSVGTAA